MLQTISIKNVALIKSIEINFDDGLNILLGETGAGKSIIFDALNFVLGAKPDKSLIRSGESEMRVDAVFSSLSSSAIATLNDMGFEGEEVLLSRTYSLDGKGSIRINSAISTQALLKEVGSLLVDSYSQHENVALLKAKSHLIMLDKFGGNEIASQKEVVKALYEELNDINKKIAGLGGDEFERERRKTLLDYQIQEIEKANLKVGEDDEVLERLKFLESAEKIYESTSICNQVLSEGGNNCLDLLSQACNALSSLSQFKDIEECRERLTSVRYEVEDISDQLRDIASSTEFDQKEYDKLDARNDLIKSLTKKYGGTIEKTLEFLNQSKEQLLELEDSAFLLQQLDANKKTVYDRLQHESEKLSSIRKETALKIRKLILKELKDLGMKSSEFDVKFDRQEISPSGIDNVEFIFSANKGQEVKALSKTASGGELSRFMLAFKNIFATSGDAQTLIFDEIDAGISGETGNIVGDKLKSITSHSQVICITHLPQVACRGDNFYFVSKKEENQNTVTYVKKLEENEIIESIAHLIVGDKITQTALNQAKELRESASV